MNFAVAKTAENSNKVFRGFSEVEEASRPILLLTINNGAGHTRAAEAICAAWRKNNKEIPARVVEVSEFMSRAARFTHVSLYLWLVKHAPRVWDAIDRYQKRQTNTSPTWFYRRECRKLFDLARRVQPRAIVATEVGCLEIAALIKRDLSLRVPLVAVNVNYDADRAWIQPEVDLFCLASPVVSESFIESGADGEKISITGVPMQAEFKVLSDEERFSARGEICRRFQLDASQPFILVAGGGEGMGKIEVIARLLLKNNAAWQIVVLAGRNEKLKRNCEKLAKSRSEAARLRVLGWTPDVPILFQAADLMVSKLGNTFDEAMACGLPIIALEPPPGAERIQYALLEELEIGRAVKNLNQLTRTIEKLLSEPETLAMMRCRAARFSRTEAAERIAAHIEKRIGEQMYV